MLKPILDDIKKTMAEIFRTRQQAEAAALPAQDTDLGDTEADLERTLAAAYEKYGGPDVP